MIHAEHGEYTPDPADEWDDLAGLYYPLDYVLRTWNEHRQYHVLPDAGGWNDQDWRLVEHDWPLVTMRYNRLHDQLYPPENPTGRRTTTDLPPVRNPRTMMDLA